MATVEEAPLQTIKIAPEERSRLSNQAVTLTLATNILLAILKTVVGIVGHSTALLADGVNSTSDVVYNIVVTLFVRSAHQPADSEHPYGHTQLESVGALVVGAFVITTALTIFWNSVNSLFNMLSGDNSVERVSIWALIIALFTIALKIGLSLYSRKIGDKTQNPAIVALALDHRNDVFSALAVVIGIVLSRMGYLWVDPAAGAIVAFVILRTGIGILRESTDDLMDTVPGDRLLSKLTEILDHTPSVYRIETMQAHRFGQYLVINMTIVVDGNLTIDEGDRISDQVEAQLKEEIDYVRAVHVHFHSRHSSK